MSRTKLAARKGNGTSVHDLLKSKYSESKTDEAAKTFPKQRMTSQRTKSESSGNEINDRYNSNENVPSPLNLQRQKRDRDAFESDNSAAKEPATKKKKYKSKKERELLKSSIQKETSGAGDNLDAAIAQMDPALLADHFAKQLRAFSRKETELEIEEKFLPSATFKDSTSYTSTRVKTNLPKFLEVMAAGAKEKLRNADVDKAKASPHTLIICASGLRGADMARELRVYQNEHNTIAKLFAKHFKMEQQAVYLRKTHVGFGVGTPDRVRKLMDSEALKIGRLERIVVDGSFADEKRRGLWNMKDVFMPLLELLRMDEVQEKVAAGELKVLVF